ncbi:MAG: ecdysteroid 22-kinase family protein [Firmicutes bacterium]|nr:ecdysteroid 22-kinase family protein [Bacillota bacterium]
MDQRRQDLFRLGSYDREVSEILTQAFPGTKVASFEIDQLYCGTNRSAKVAVRYVDEKGPPSVFLKVAGGYFQRLSLLCLGALYKEAELAVKKINLPFRHPALYGGQIDKKSLFSLVVMEDIDGKDSKINTPLDALEPEQARFGLRELAKLHAAYWDKEDNDLKGLIGGWRLAKPLQVVSVVNLMRSVKSFYSLINEENAFTDSLREELLKSNPYILGDSQRMDPVRLSREFSRSALLYASGTQTVLHGDPHIGNTYLQSGSGLGFFDLQLLRLGNWSHDVGYFLISSLTSDDRREHMEDLVEYYFDQLSLLGISPPDSSDGKRQILYTPAFGLVSWLHTLAFKHFQKQEYCLAMIGRFLSAYYDFETSAMFEKYHHRELL